MTADLRWAAPPAPARPSLDRPTIVSTALAVADADGLAALSMPRLARELGTAPMSLYRHVPGKEALVDLVLDEALGAPPELAGRSLRAGCERWATALRDVLAEHPWAVPLMAGDRTAGPAECGWAEALLAHAVDRGRPLPEAVEVLHLVHGYVRGAAALAGDRLPTAHDLERSGRSDGLPVLARLLGGAAVRGPGGVEPLFDSGLRRTLDAVEPAP
ncbi:MULTISPECIES: TetR/AcrR family transcriptional regulator [unclassified Pseudonocardia]|uniref:TetR/AcrR family transcriptional regulator n=1 Tax=unclassified Pseudonocardia TaxID=2619320 RepID=UPI0001FFE5B6|nr:TetR/AcrR family transcriptional regulator [Pseudonocardia sp. Ae707_Ps1]OLM18805.1 Transcriptional regulator, TetR family [Pseudonocardia sp. Ae707_Ps1]